MKRKVIIFAVSLLFFLGSLTSLAYGQTPRRYYDWSATLETRQGVNVLGLQTLAQETSTPTTSTQNAENFTQFDRYVIGGNLLPTNPFYFLKRMQESLQLAFTTNPEIKTKMRVAIGGERLGEMEELVKINSSAVDTAADYYQAMMNTAAEELKRLNTKTKEAKDLLKEIEQETAKHNIILEKVAAQAPDSAKDGLQQALQASWKGTDTVADLEGRPAIPADMVGRIQALKAQGLLTEEEAAKLIGLKKREEARKEMEKYVNEGIIPAADFLRLNENTKNLYPDEFFQLHELKRFYELQKLEAEKPDEATLAKVQEFAKTYKAGEIVPNDIRKYWGWMVGGEEIQNTIRLDLVDESWLKQKPKVYQRFTVMVETFKPRPEDIAYLNNFIEKNKADINSLPPEYQRMYHLSRKYGAQCGEGQRWVPLPQTGGVCVKEGEDIRQLDLPRMEEFAKGKSCTGSIVSAKGPGEVCSAYPSDCVPPGWTKTTTCVETPEEVGKFNTIRPKKIDCPSNAHYVSFIEACVPNYTPVAGANGEGTPGFTESVCPTGYHRNYAGGPCLPDYNQFSSATTTFTSFSLPPLTQTPGAYPSPIYISTGQCGPNSHWVPEPINPVGGYCAPDNYNYTGSGGTSTTTSSCSPPSSGCPSNSTWDKGTCTCKPPCPTGTSWNGGYCMNDSAPPSGSTNSCQPPSTGCGTNKYWDYGSCVCRDQGSYPSSCAYPSGGCGSGQWWDNTSCSCRPTSSSNTTGGTTSGSTCSSATAGMCTNGSWFDAATCSCKWSSSGGGSTYQPPSGYGSCPSGQYWTGTYCASSTGAGTSSTTSTTTSTPAPTQTPTTQNCSSNQYWDGSKCVDNQSQPTSAQQAPTQPPPTQPPQGNQSCPSGQYWNGSNCVQSQESGGGNMSSCVAPQYWNGSACISP